MGKARLIAEGVYLIGGPDVSRGDDAASFIIDFCGGLVMIDAAQAVVPGCSRRTLKTPDSIPRQSQR